MTWQLRGVPGPTAAQALALAATLALTASLALTGTLAGCAHYRNHPIDTATTARHILARRLDDPGLTRFLTAMNLPPDHRWGLRALTLTAVYNRPNLRIANAAAAIAAGAVVTAKALPNPVLSLRPTYNATNGNPSPIKIGPIVNFLIGSLGARQAGIAAARDRVIAAQDLVTTAAWQVRARVRNALLVLWSARHQLTLAQENQHYASAVAAAIDQRYRAGMVASVAYDQSELLAEQAAFAVAQARRSIALARATLASAIGLPPAALTNHHFSTETFNHPPRPGTITRLIHQALIHRPDVVAALARYQASQQDLRAAIDSQFPGLSIGPGYHYAQGASKYILALAVPLPIFNQNQGPIAVARAQRQLAAANLIAAQLHVLDQIGAATARYHASRAELRTARHITRRAEAAVTAARAAFRAGATGSVRLLGAEQAAIVARQNQLTAAIKVRTALGRLEDGLHHPFYGLRP